MNCHHCKSEVKVSDKISRQEQCPGCGSYLHCCLNCRLHHQSAYHECREDQAEWVRDKESANFCDYFEPKVSTGPTGASKAEEARKKLDQLFKKKP